MTKASHADACAVMLAAAGPFAVIRKAIKQDRYFYYFFKNAPVEISAIRSRTEEPIDLIIQVFLLF